MRSSKKIITAALAIAVPAIIALTVTAVSDSEESDAAISYQNFFCRVINVGQSSFIDWYNGGVGNMDVSVIKGTLPPGFDLARSTHNSWRLSWTATTSGIFSFVLDVEEDPEGPFGFEDEEYHTFIIQEMVTFHNANGTVTERGYMPNYPFRAPTGASTTGNTFCGWNTAPDGSGTTYLMHSLVPPGTKDLYAQQSASPVTIKFSYGISSSSNYTNGIIPGQLVMMPVYHSSTAASIPSSILAVTGFSANSDGSGTFYPLGEPAIFRESATIYGVRAAKDPSRTVVISGTAAFYVDRGDTFDFTFVGLPYGMGDSGVARLPYISTTREVVGYGYTMTADTDVIIVTHSDRGPAPIRVEYEANGGAGTMRSDATGFNDGSLGELYGTKASAPAFAPPAGKMFRQWRLNSPAGPAISPGGAVNATGEPITLYAEWMDIPPDPVYAITYDGNGTGGAISPETVVRGQPYTITSQLFTPPNQKSFLGWSILGGTGGTLYPSGGVFTPTADTTLVAVWKWDYFFVNLIPNGAPGETVTIQSPGEEPYIMPESQFSWEGHTFTGWRINDEPPTMSVGYSIQPQSNLNLYAQWLEISDDNEGGGEGDEDKDKENGGYDMSPFLAAIIIEAILTFLAVIWAAVRDE